MIRFLWPWPNFQGNHIIKTLKMSPVCTLSFFLISWKRSDGYSSFSADTFISILCTYIRKRAWGQFSWELLPFVKFCVCLRHFFLISWKCSDGYSSISADTLKSIRCTYIRTRGPWATTLTWVYCCKLIRSFTHYSLLAHQEVSKQWLKQFLRYLAYKVKMLKFSKGQVKKSFFFRS